MRKRKGKEDEGIDFWQPTSDMLTGLILMLLLLLLLLLLYLMRKPEEIEKTAYETEPIAWDEDWAEEEPTERVNDEEQNNGGSNNGSGGDETETETEPESETESEGEYPYPEDMAKAAVYVKVVDEETGQLIAQEGITFELYENDKTLKILNTYYPEKVSYRDYETTDKGIFFLPEKIPEGFYYFRNVSEIEGYDLAENVHFSIEEPYDWPDPYVVTIPVSPCKNVIRIQMEDSDTGVAVAGGSFEVLAAQDILTGDGTLRYKEGEIVCEFECNEGGYGESGELYLGEYIVRQKEIPEYYAGIDGEYSVSVEKRTDVEPELLTVSCEKTLIALKLTDELYNTQPMEGVSFQITGGSLQDPVTLITDYNGMIYVEGLDKNTEYYIAQSDTKEGYAILQDTYTVSVDREGHIDGENSSEIKSANRCLRVAINVEDALTGQQVPDKNLALYDSDGNQLKTWVTGQSGDLLEDLGEGSYYLLMDEDESEKYEIRVKNEKEIQNHRIRVWTKGDYGIVAGVAAGLLILIAVLILLGRKGLRKRKERAREYENE